MHFSPRSPSTVVMTAMLIVLAALPAIAAERPPMYGLATFDGGHIDLRDGWGDAEACVVWGTERGVECFGSEAELVAHIESVEKAGAIGESAALASQCSTSLKLYDGIGYTGAALHLYQRTTWVNLSNHGWSNRTSSYKVGACSSIFADGANGGGDRYPISLTEANDVATSMTSGWNNKVSSVYIG